MILKLDNETTLDAIQRMGAEYSVNPYVLEDEGSGNVALLWEMLGVLAGEVKRLRSGLGWSTEPSSTETEKP